MGCHTLNQFQQQINLNLFNLVFTDALNLAVTEPEEPNNDNKSLGGTGE